jgi:mono/diheme cytochrome c family protein
MTKPAVVFATALFLGAPTPVLRAADDAQAKKGEAVYTAQKCSVCHQIAGKGNKANPLDGVGAKLTAEQIKQWIVDPAAAATAAKSTKTPKMPAKYKTLPVADVDALVAYMQSLK